MVHLDPIGTQFNAFLNLLREGKISPLERRFLYSAVTNVLKSRAQLFQDAWVLYETEGKSNGYYVEFGASDGLLFSNTYALEKYHGWLGALAEPCPAYHKNLVANRGENFISKKGVGPRHGVFPMTVAPDNTLSTFLDFAQTDHLSIDRDGGYKANVEVQTLNSFLEEASAPAVIDFLSIDTEGSELSILNVFDWDKYEITHICVEHNYTTDRDEIHRLLVGRGYSRRFERLSLWDDWYVLDR